MGFGNRAFINLYPILSIPLACFIQFVLSKKLLVQLPIYAVIIAGIGLNIFQSIQFKSATLHWGAMTKEAYWEIFAKSERPPNYTDLIKAPDYEMAIKGKNER